MPFQYKHRVWLQSLDYVVEDNTYASVLSALAAGISAAQTSIEHIKPSESPELAEIVWAEEGEVIESFLGTAYVLCQTRITAVTRRALWARKHALHKRLEFPAFGCKEHEVRKRGEPFNDDHSKIEVLWQLANDFKHRDEWPLSTSDDPMDEGRRLTWVEPEKGAPRWYTLRALEAVGIDDPFSHCNLRAGAEALGLTDYATLTILGDIIACWANDVRSVTRKAFGQ